MADDGKTEAHSGLASETFHVELESGQQICIRRIEKSDETRLREGIAALSPRSRYLRFMSGAPSPPDWVIDRLLDVDGKSHLAWGAIDMDSSERPAIGAVHAIRPKRGGPIDLSVAVLDEYQEAGVGSLLTAVLLAECKAQGIDSLVAQTLAENRAAVGFIANLGGQRVSTQSAVSLFTLNVGEALTALRSNPKPLSLTSLFS